VPSRYLKNIILITIEYNFVDQRVSRKFGDEQRIGTLPPFFRTYNSYIILGLFGRAGLYGNKIALRNWGVRKFLGASVARCYYNAV